MPQLLLDTIGNSQRQDIYLFWHLKVAQGRIEIKDPIISDLDKDPIHKLCGCHPVYTLTGNILLDVRISV